MDSNIAIEKAKVSDINDIMEIEYLSFDSDQFTKRQFDYLITKAKGVFYIIRCGAKVVGYISLLKNLHTGNLRIYSIAVHPSARGRRYAELFIDKSVEYAVNNHLKAINLEVRIDNQAVIGLYEKCGFVKTHVKAFYYSDGTDAYAMKLLLESTPAVLYNKADK